MSVTVSAPTSELIGRDADTRTCKSNLTGPLKAENLHIAFGNLDFRRGVDCNIFTVMYLSDWPEGGPRVAVGISMFVCTSGRSKVDPPSPVGVPGKMVGCFGFSWHTVLALRGLSRAIVVYAHITEHDCTHVMLALLQSMTVHTSRWLCFSGDPSLVLRNSAGNGESDRQI